MNKEQLRLGTLLIASTMPAMMGATVMPSLPKIQAHFSGEPNAEFLIRLFLAIPFIFTSVCAPFAGFIVDRYGRKRILLFSLFVFGIAGTTGCYAESLLSLIMGRALLGFALAGVTTPCMTLIADYYPGEKRKKAMGFQAFFIQFGSMFYLTTSGILGDINWRAPFFLFAIAFFALIVGHFFLTEPEHRPNDGAINEERGDEKFPFLTVGLIYSITLITMGTYYMVGVLFPLYSVELGVTRSTIVGLVMAISTCISALVSLRYSTVSRHLSFSTITLIGTIVIGIGCCILYFSTNFTVAMGAVFFSALGFGLFMPNVNVWVNMVAPLAYRGRAVGGLMTSFFLGMFFAPLVSHPLTAHFGISFTFAIAGCFIIVLGAILSLASFKLQGR